MKILAEKKKRQLLAYLMFNVGLLILVQMNLEKAGSVKTESDPLADNLSRVHEVVKDSTVHGDQGTAAGSLLLLLVHFPCRLR